MIFPDFSHRSRPARIHRSQRRGGRRRGATAILYTCLLAFLIIPLLGLSIDLVRVYAVQGRLQSAVDAGALGAERLLSTDANTSEIATEFVKANYPASFWSSGTPSNISVSVTTTTNQNPNKSTVSVSASLAVPTIFLGRFSNNRATAAATGSHTSFSLQGCTLSYPTGSAPALSSVVFNESGVLAAYGPTFVYPHGKIIAWYSDEHALTLGIRQVQVVTTDGTSPLTLTFTPQNGSIGSSYNLTMTGAGGTPPYTFSISALPTGLSLNSTTGVISGIPTAQFNSQVTATLTDSAGGTVTANGTINIGAETPLSLTVPGGANGNVGSNFTLTLNATGGYGPYTFSITSGSLPGGLSLNASTGVVSGIPTSQASGPAANVTFAVTDSKNTSAVKTGAITIAAAQPLTLTVPPLTATVGTAFSATLTASGGYYPYTFSSGSLPAGLTLNASTGVISGSPTTAVSGPGGNVTFTVTDHAGSTNNQAGAFTITAAAGSGSGSAVGSGSGSGSTGTTTGTPVTTSTNYTIATYSSATQSAVSFDTPLAVGTTALSGQQAGTDGATWNSTYSYDDAGRPMWPAMFITDITLNASSTSGDWQQGGTAAIPPNAVYGTWKGAVRTVDTTTSPYTITVTPDADPSQNDWTGVPDTPPGGFPATQGYGAEVVWYIDSLGLRPGRSYRLQFMIHDGDQNQSGGDVGEGCSVAIY